MFDIHVGPLSDTGPGTTTPRLQWPWLKQRPDHGVAARTTLSEIVVLDVSQDKLHTLSPPRCLTSCLPFAYLEARLRLDLNRLTLRTIIHSLLFLPVISVNFMQIVSYCTTDYR